MPKLKKKSVEEKNKILKLKRINNKHVIKKNISIINLHNRVNKYINNKRLDPQVKIKDNINDRKRKAIQRSNINFKTKENKLNNIRIKKLRSNNTYKEQEKKILLGLNISEKILFTKKKKIIIIISSQEQVIKI